MLSRRAPWSAPRTKIAATIERRRATGSALIDLTASNPTTAGFHYPHEELREILSRAASARHEPDPRGLRSAREAVAAEIGAHPDRLVLTASTSEAYSFLFKLLADPGQKVIAFRPAYPLIAHIAELDAVGVTSVPLAFHQRWEIDPDALREAITPDVGAIAVVNPNNPTGSFVGGQERALLTQAGLPLISDEVFLDYPIEAAAPTLAGDDGEALVFALGGLSKSCGLPHYKLGWIRVSGPDAAVREALDGLEWIADNFLSVNTPVQVALPELFPLGRKIREQIRARIKQNLAALDEQLAPFPAISRLPVEGGWSAVVRIPRLRSDEEIVLSLIETHGVMVQPGYFFDVDVDGHLVVSLLTEPETFRAGVEAIVAESGRESASL